MLRRVRDELAEIQRAMAEGEQIVGLRGRTYFGTFDLGGDEYRICVKLRDGDDPAAFGLEPGTLPGGRYARVRLRGEPPALYELIGPTFAELQRRGDVDATRPGIEHYRRHDELDLLLPIR